MFVGRFRCQDSKIISRVSVKDDARYIAALKHLFPGKSDEEVSAAIATAVERGWSAEELARFLGQDDLVTGRTDDALLSKIARAIIAGSGAVGDELSFEIAYGAVEEEPKGKVGLFDEEPSRLQRFIEESNRRHGIGDRSRGATRPTADELARLKPIQRFVALSKARHGGGA